VDAAFKAIEKIIGCELTLEDYQITSVTEGEDALGDARVRIKTAGGAVFSGRGHSTEVLEAGIHAYVNADTTMLYAEKEGVGAGKPEAGKIDAI
jgi:2-isopropylmalate synthase